MKFILKNNSIQTSIKILFYFRLTRLVQHLDSPMADTSPSTPVRTRIHKIQSQYTGQNQNIPDIVPVHWLELEYTRYSPSTVVRARIYKIQSQYTCQNQNTQDIVPVHHLKQENTRYNPSTLVRTRMYQIQLPSILVRIYQIKSQYTCQNQNIPDTVPVHWLELEYTRYSPSTPVRTRI